MGVIHIYCHFQQFFRFISINNCFNFRRQILILKKNTSFQAIKIVAKRAFPNLGIFILILYKNSKSTIFGIFGTLWWHFQKYSPIMCRLVKMGGENYRTVTNKVTSWVNLNIGGNLTNKVTSWVNLNIGGNLTNKVTSWVNLNIGGNLTNKMNCELMLTYDTPALRHTGSRNLTGQKTLPTIWGTYMKLVTKYQISAIDSCWEKCNEKWAYMFNVYKNQ